MSESQATSIENQLEQSYQALDEARRNNDWEALASLEPEARKAIQQAVEQGSSPTVEVQRLLNDLKSLYQEMIDACQLERDHIQEQIMASRKRQEALSSYLDGQKNMES